MKTTQRRLKFRALDLVVAAVFALPLTSCGQQPATDKVARYEELRKQGQDKENAGQNTEALDLYLKARVLVADDPGLHYRIARAAAKAKRAVEGKEAIATLFKLEPKATNDPVVLGWQAGFDKPATGSASPSVPAPATAKLDARAQLELDTLKGMVGESETTTDPQQKRRILGELLDRSALFAREHPDVTEIWLYRAVAALALERPQAGWEAGQKLLAQGGLENSDPRLREALVQLNRRKWLGATQPSSNGPAAGQKYENSLGMKLAPVAGTDALFCIWETRVKDYSTFATANPDVDGSWRNVKFEKVAVSDGPTHPVVNVSWEDARAFCAWLTKKEQEEGRLTEEQRYRLPTDLEWSAAVGLRNEDGDTPKERDTKIKGVYPWGTDWPPPSGAGNFADASFKAAGGSWEIEGYSDGYATTSPAGSFSANRHGLYDLAGNVWEWCEDWYDHEEKARVLRGGSWSGVVPDGLLSSYRGNYVTPDFRDVNFGYRVVLVVSPAR